MTVGSGVKIRPKKKRKLESFAAITSNPATMEGETMAVKLRMVMDVRHIRLSNGSCSVASKFDCAFDHFNMIIRDVLP